MTENKEKTICPHCGSSMKKWEVPQFSQWTSEYLYICFNDDCPYFVQGWEVIRERNNTYASYRHRYDPVADNTGPIPVWSATALRDGILDEG